MINFHLLICMPVGQAVTCSSLEWEVQGSNLWSVKLDTVLPTARRCCCISSKGAVLPEFNDAKMGLANSLNALALYSEYNERFDNLHLYINFFFRVASSSVIVRKGLLANTCLQLELIMESPSKLLRIVNLLYNIYEGRFRLQVDVSA